VAIVYEKAHTLRIFFSVSTGKALIGQIEQSEVFLFLLLSIVLVNVSRLKNKIIFLITLRRVDNSFHCAKLGSWPVGL